MYKVFNIKIILFVSYFSFILSSCSSGHKSNGSSLMNTESDYRNVALIRRTNADHPLFGNRQFRYKGKALKVDCILKDESAKVVIKNPNNEPIMMQGLWVINYYSKTYRIIHTQRSYQANLLAPISSLSFTESFAPEDAAYCIAKLNI